MFFSYFFNHVNWLALAVAAFAYFILGAIWYSPVLFSKSWMKFHNIVPQAGDSMKGLPMMLAMTVVMNFVTALGVAMLVMVFHPPGILGGLKVGLLAGGCFAAPPLMMTHMYTKKPFMVWIIDAGYHVVSIAMVAVIMTAWK